MMGIHGGDIYRNQVQYDFSVNVNPLGMPEEFRATMLEAMRKCQTYPDIEAGGLKQALSEKLQIPQSFLLFGNGASELFLGIIHAAKPKKILIPVPSFYGYEYAAGASEGEIVYHVLQEENQFLPGEDFLQLLTEDVDVVFLANPNNPTGMRMERSYLEKVLTICRERNILVVLDECFIEFCGEGASMQSEIANFPNLMLVRAFTKIFAIPGVRLGYLICSNTSLIKTVAGHLPEWNLSVFAQDLGVACTKQDAYIDRTVPYVREQRQFLQERLKQFGLKVWESDTNYILFYSDKPLYDMLLEKGILIRDCENFRGLAKGYYRIAVKSRKENEMIVKAIGECIGQNRAIAAGRD